MSKAFVYTEMQFSVPFNKAPWRELNPLIRAQPGFVNKTWLSGFKNNSVGSTTVDGVLASKIAWPPGFHSPAK